jgi:hypothetical protein
MKTSIYNKEEHIEGYVGSGKENVEESAVQKQYEAGNDGNEVTSFGKEPIADKNAGDLTRGKDVIFAKDGLDNTGTQGKDSLSDDAYNSTDKNPTLKSAESRTGSSSEDFKDKPNNGLAKRDEDDALNTGI